MPDNFMEKSAPTSMISVEESREIAEIKAKMFLARQFPRDITYCMQNIEMECKQPGLAEIAQFSYPKGGQEVKGASIRLIEVIARHWGNVISGIKELSRTDKGCTAKAYAWDLETNTADEKVFDIAYVRNTRNGSYPVTDEREKYELMANYATRRKRACLQAVIPGYVIDAALKICDETMTENMGGGAKTIEELRQATFEVFTSIADWITPEMLGSIIGKDFDKANKQDLVRIKKLYNAIKEGFIKPEIAFGIEEESKPEFPSAEEEAAANALVDQLGFGNESDN